jgi:hypothetical protein
VAYRRVDAKTAARRRRAAQFVRLWSFITFGSVWLTLLGYIVLALAGKTDKIPSTPLAVLTLLASWVASRLFKELADQIERGEWP